jgi:hypothetical protein
MRTIYSDRVESRSLCLLVNSMSYAQIVTMITNGFMRIGGYFRQGDGNGIPVRLYYQGTVFVFSPNTRRWMHRCIEPRSSLPNWDNVYAKKLLIESDFDYFMGASNVIGSCHEGELKGIYYPAYFLTKLAKYYSMYTDDFSLPRKIVKILESFR